MKKQIFILFMLFSLNLYSQYDNFTYSYKKDTLKVEYHKDHFLVIFKGAQTDTALIKAYNLSPVLYQDSAVVLFTSLGTSIADYYVALLVSHTLRHYTFFYHICPHMHIIITRQTWQKFFIINYLTGDTLRVFSFYQQEPNFVSGPFIIKSLFNITCLDDGLIIYFDPYTYPYLKEQYLKQKALYIKVH